MGRWCCAHAGAAHPATPECATETGVRETLTFGLDFDVRLSSVLGGGRRGPSSDSDRPTRPVHPPAPCLFLSLCLSPPDARAAGGPCLVPAPSFIAVLLVRSRGTRRPAHAGERTHQTRVRHCLLHLLHEGRVRPGGGTTAAGGGGGAAARPHPLPISTNLVQARRFSASLGRAHIIFSACSLS